LPLDKLKIDQSFVGRIERDRTSQAITKAIIYSGAAAQAALGITKTSFQDRSRSSGFARPRREQGLL
jgi:predicted signal transduction protein with EAL and GGDEF domain